MTSENMQTFESFNSLLSLWQLHTLSKFLKTRHQLHMLTAQVKHLQLWPYWKFKKLKKLATSQELVPSVGTPYKLRNQETTVIFSEHLTCLNSFNQYNLFTKPGQLYSLTL